MDMEIRLLDSKMDSFSCSIVEGSEVVVPMADAIWVQKVIETAYRSSEEGKILNVEG